ncbi:MAG: PepSY domain-containing protein [Methanobacterium sp.]
MIKKSVIAIVAIIAAFCVVFAVFGVTGINDDNKSTYNSSDQPKQQNNQTVSNDTIPKTTEKTGISAAEAKEIAQNYIKAPGAKAGTPKLVTINGNEVYAVPVMDNGLSVGEIDINAQTGKNVGGAGGP